MPLRLINNAPAQTTIALALGSGATSFVGGSTALFTVPQSFGAGQGSLTILDRGNPAWNDATPLATPYEYAYYTTNTTGTNTISGMTRGVAGTSAHSFFAGAIVAQGLLAEDIVSSVPWKFDEQSPTGASVTVPASGSIPASYLGVNWRHIQVVICGRLSAASTVDTVNLRFNGDVGANYTWSSLAAVAASPVGVLPAGASSIAIGVLPAATAPASLPGVIYLDIPEFANTSFLRIAQSRVGAHGGGTSFEDALFFGNWNASTALTSFTLSVASLFVSPSRITTYLLP